MHIVGSGKCTHPSLYLGHRGPNFTLRASHAHLISRFHSPVQTAVNHLQSSQYFCPWFPSLPENRALAKLTLDLDPWPLTIVFLLTEPASAFDHTFHVLCCLAACFLVFLFPRPSPSAVTLDPVPSSYLPLFTFTMCRQRRGGWENCVLEQIRRNA